MKNPIFELKPVGRDKLSVGGFHQEWLSIETENAEGELIELNLTSGAGCGNPIMSMTITEGEKSTSFNVDVGSVCKEFLKKHIASPA